MKQLLIAVPLLLGGGVAGYFLSEAEIGGFAKFGRTDTKTESELVRLRLQDETKIKELQAEINRLLKLLEEKNANDAEVETLPADSVESIERAIEEVYADNNVDWLLDVIKRLLRMGERGYPILRRLMMDIIFKGKFLPSQSDFRIDQGYAMARIFADNERQFIGFLDFLLSEPDTHPWFKQGALMGGAFYVGSNAPGSEDLKQTMMQLFMSDMGPGMIPGLPPQAANRMQVFAMMMSGDKRMIEPLRDRLNNSKDKREQSDIIGALAYLGDPQAVPLIKDRLNPAEGDFRREIRSLGRVGTDEAHNTASEFLRTIPDSKRFYQHARDYVRAGGGDSAVHLIRQRFQADPQDPEVKSAIGTLRRYPTKESLSTLNSIANESGDADVRKRAAAAAKDVDNRLKGIVPGMEGVPGAPPPPR